MRVLALMLMLSSSALAQEREARGGREGTSERRAGTTTACATTLQGSRFVTGDWTVSGLVAAAPTLTASYAAGPSGSCDSSGAARLQTASTTTGQFSAIFNKNGTSAHDFCPQTGGLSISYGCWAKAAVAKTFDFCAYTTAASWRCDSFAATTAYQWFEKENLSWADCVATGNDTCQFLIGGAPVVNTGTVDRPAMDLQLWGCRCVRAATISP
jgi:hypothetical protein